MSLCPTCRATVRRVVDELRLAAPNQPTRHERGQALAIAAALNTLAGDDKLPQCSVDTELTFQPDDLPGWDPEPKA